MAVGVLEKTLNRNGFSTAGLFQDIIKPMSFQRYGNGVVIFTTSGVAVRKFQNDVESGLDSFYYNLTLEELARVHGCNFDHLGVLL